MNELKARQEAAEQAKLKGRPKKKLTETAKGRAYLERVSKRRQEIRQRKEAKRLELEIQKRAKFERLKIKTRANDRALVESRQQIKAAVESTGGRRRLLRSLLREMAYRRTRSVELYKPLPKQLGFHMSQAPERLALGANRSGKTICCVAEIAWALTATHPYWKYPNRGMRVMCVAKNLIKIGEVIYQKLFKPGAFDCVIDKETGLMRAWNPLMDGFDVEKIPAFPFIDERMIKTIAWERKGISVPKKVTLHGGHEITFWTADGKPPNGMEADFVHFDEEVESREWKNEVDARLSSRGGRFIWSATPEAASQILWELHEEAKSQEGSKRPRIEEFHMILDDSPFLTDEARDDFKHKAARDPDNFKVKIMGEFLIKSKHVYPEFYVAKHCVPYREIPPEWCRYLVVDPGFAKQMTIFVAVPPPDSPEAGHVYIYDELYMRSTNVMDFVETLEQKARGQAFQAFIIDNHGARRTEANGKTWGQQYAEQFEKRNLRSVETDYDFYYMGGEQKRYGEKTLSTEVAQVREWLWDNPRLNDQPVLRIIQESCPTLINHMKNYQHKMEDGKPVDKIEDRHFSEGPDCFDAETEVLTDYGWKKFADLNGAEKCATVNLKTDKIEYHLPTDYIARHYEGEMIKFGGLTLDALVTPNHRMVGFYGGPKPYRDIPRIFLAKDLTKYHALKMKSGWDGVDHKTIRIKSLGGNTRYPDAEVDAGDLSEFLGWYLAEGCCVKTAEKISGRGYQVVIAQKHPEKRLKLKSLLDRLPWNWCDRGDAFYCSSKQLWMLLNPLGNRSWNKRLPDWVRWASPRIINRFIDGAILGDGWVHKKDGSRAYASTSKELADGMQELFMKVGIHSSVRVKQPQLNAGVIRGRQVVGRRVQYHVRERLCNKAWLGFAGTPNFETVQYAGMVYCVSVPNETLIVRRNGKPLITGNCLRYAVLHGVPWVYPTVVKRVSRAWTNFLKSRRNKRDGNYIILGSS